jgi:hypothetical protein
MTSLRSESITSKQKRAEENNKISHKKSLILKKNCTSIH